MALVVALFGVAKVTVPGPEDFDQEYVRVPDSGSVDPVPSKPTTNTPVVPADGPVATAVGAAAHATPVSRGLAIRAKAVSSANAERPKCRVFTAEMPTPIPHTAIAPIPCFP